MELLTALTIGLLGSLHCAGMCGPIAIAIPLPKESWLNKLIGAVLYNFGRILTYGILGALFGLMGRGIRLAGLQQWASIVIGAIMIISVLFPFILKEKIKLDKLFTGYSGQLTASFRRLFGKASAGSLLLTGILNGLLPCGLVYVAVAGAINTNDIVTGAAFMMMFGLGTSPMLLGISLAGSLLSIGLKLKLSKVIPVFIVILGLLFILRGMSLGIPYISPKTEKLEVKTEVKTGEPCCK
jgi:sulfite exporter TauE/SafE